MSKQTESVAEMAASLTGEPEVGSQVEREIQNSRLITTLLNLRLQKGMTQKQIAEFMGCDSSKISKMESGNDLNLKWADIVQYLSAMHMRINLNIEDTSLPAAMRIKMYVFRIHELLESLSELAAKESDDSDLTDKINQFYGEVLFNFVMRFEENYEKLSSVIRFPEPVTDKTSQAIPEENSESSEVSSTVTG